jgi:hypothetical protein
MSRKTIARKPNKKERIRREKDPIPWRYCLTTLACGLFLVVGFFGAARQHFSSIDYGIKNSKLRNQIAELEAENRRLLLSKEIALSPGEIKKYAKKIGMVELSASNIEIFSTREEKNTSKEKSGKPMVEKTVDAKPVRENGKEKTAFKEIVTTAGLRKDGKPLKNSDSKTDQRARIVK